jgi:very-short-patch-repair endonuclease
MTPRDWLRSRAKALRAEMTDAEKAMWRLLHEGELVALNWRKQAPFGEFILDFVSHPARLVIEVDGSQHGESDKSSQDAGRTAWLNSKDYEVLRFWNTGVSKTSGGVWQAIYSAAAVIRASLRMKRWRDDHMASIQQNNARLASSSSMEEAPRSGGGGARVMVKEESLEARLQDQRATPPLSSLRDDSSSIEEERDA